VHVDVDKQQRINRRKIKTTPFVALEKANELSGGEAGHVRVHLPETFNVNDHF